MELRDVIIEIDLEVYYVELFLAIAAALAEEV